MLAKFLQDDRAGGYVVGGELVVMKERGEAFDPLFSPAEAGALGNARETIFLGLLGAAPRFGFGLDPAAIEPLKARNDLKITDLRTIAVQGLVDAVHLPPLAEAKALIGWHGRHRFCPNCGTPTRVVQGGWRRDCPSCKAEHFPRTDPVVIMLAIAGERCVLGRSPRFAPTMWSCAGRLRRAWRNDRGSGAARDTGRSRHPLRQSHLCHVAAVAVPDAR